jgi:hypothetical protein
MLGGLFGGGGPKLQNAAVTAPSLNDARREQNSRYTKAAPQQAAPRAPVPMPGRPAMNGTVAPARRSPASDNTGGTVVNNRGQVVTQQVREFYNPDTNKFEARVVYAA